MESKCAKLSEKAPNIVDKGLAPCFPSKSQWCSQVGVGAQGHPHGSPSGLKMPINHL